MKKKIYKGSDMQVARSNAGHTLVKASVESGVSVNTIVEFEKRNELPKNVNLQNAIFTYIDKYFPTKTKKKGTRK